ncbi:MAG: hypothetical protein LBI87_03625 [Candidatus Accumulibacter sp.]|jgi:hypothetical protein|nr:hypothetical protein [Accumulibacter sp.]
MMRAFLPHARADAAFVANTRHGAKTNGHFYAMQREAAQDEDRRAAQDACNAIAAHYAENPKRPDTPIQDRLTALTTVRQLATSPAYHLQNLMQSATRGRSGGARPISRRSPIRACGRYSPKRRTPACSTWAWTRT